jgi:hypothetical protein
MASQPASTSDATPISPIHRISTFPHKTSPAVSATTPLINTDTPAINAGAPIELPADSVHSPAEFPGNGSGRKGEDTSKVVLQQKQQRANDKGVIVDVPSEPTAEEVWMAESRGRGKVEEK